jgi:hypothetical protein
MSPLLVSCLYLYSIFITIYFSFIIYLYFYFAFLAILLEWLHASAVDKITLAPPSLGNPWEETLGHILKNKKIGSKGNKTKKIRNFLFLFLLLIFLCSQLLLLIIYLLRTRSYPTHITPHTNYTPHKLHPTLPHTP